MRTTVMTIWMVMLCMTAVCTAQQAPKLPKDIQFIQITQAASWNDGMASEVGEVEIIVDYTPTAYVIWNENGKRYEVNRTQAKKITSDEAAVRLLVKRQQLYASQNKMATALTTFMQNQKNQQNQNANQKPNDLQEMQDALTLLKQIQDFANGGVGGNIPMPGQPAGIVARANHWIKSVVERGQTIQLEDGSLWQLNPLNKVDAILWLAMERITIVDSGNALYPHKLINTDGRSTAEAKLISR